MRYTVNIDRGFRGVAPGMIGEFDPKDPEVLSEINHGYLLPVEDAKQKKASSGSTQSDGPTPAEEKE